MAIRKYDSYSDEEFRQMKIKLKNYYDRLTRGETIAERGGVEEIIKLFNTIVPPAIPEIAYENMPESACSSCTKRICRNLSNYFLLFPIEEEKEQVKTKEQDDKQPGAVDGVHKKRGRKAGTQS
jgi:hypothetical protein